MKRLRYILLTALVLFIFCTTFFITPLGQKLEENLGLALLFKLRGVREPPGKALIINTDDASSRQLGLPARFNGWPRTIHARLIDRLNQLGADLIVFDIHFSESKNRVADLALAESINRAGNVILVEKLYHKSIIAKEAGIVNIETIVSPMDQLADKALALAPFPLPKLPVRVNEAWLFKNDIGHIPTLPVVAFQAITWKYHNKFETNRINYGAKTDQLPQDTVLTLPPRNFIENMRQIRQSYIFDDNDPENRRRSTRDRTLSPPHLQALITMYSGKSVVPIDYYGPPATITTLTYHDILGHIADNSSPAAQVKDKVVFIGAASRTWSNQQDGFYTVFSQENGLDIAGVELAATIFSNLYENRLLQRLSLGKTFILFMVVALVFSCMSFQTRPLWAIVTLVLGMGVGMFGAVKVFTLYAIWVPLVIPLFFLPLAAFFMAICANYLQEKQQRMQIRKALGFYLPENVIEEVTRDLSFIAEGDKMVYGVCLMTDAENYTSLSESYDPLTISALMKDYYKYLFREVKKQDGVVANVIGDAMLAIWPSSQSQVVLRENGCKAALGIMKAVEEFNLKHREMALPTRIGIHAGELLVGNIGAEDHFEYAPVGDIVNTASRIEGLNKKLSSHILASTTVLEGVNSVRSRQLGSFLFSGKEQPVGVVELLPEIEGGVNKKELYFHMFPEALALFQAGRWKRAAHGFEQCLQLHDGDGPSRFFLNLCQIYSNNPPDHWQGVVQVGK